MATEITNQHLAERLRYMASLLEILDDEPFKVRAYRRAADTIERLEVPAISQNYDYLVALPGIGTKISEKILVLHDTGVIPGLAEIRARLPEHLPELLFLNGIGPKSVQTLWKRLGIESLEELEVAARRHRIRAIRGFGEKKEASILHEIERFRRQSGRMTHITATGCIEVVGSLMQAGMWHIAGSYRRRKSTLGDIDIITLEPPRSLNPRLRGVAEEMIEEGEQKTSVRIRGVRVDIRYATPENLGSMLMHLTGSKAFNIRMRAHSREMGWKLSEYGLRDLQTDTLRTFADEESLFEFLGMEYIPPELREDAGEVELAISGDLPDLVSLDDILGDLHVHSNWSDGRLSLEEIATAGSALGYEYILITDHSEGIGVVHGLNEERVRKQQHEIEIVNRNSECQLLSGIEVDILSDGHLGLPSESLGDLDLVVASVHSAFTQDRDLMTRRLISAIKNDNVDIIGHPTSRLIGHRPPSELDMERVVTAAYDAGTAFEINASPRRMDLDDIYVRQVIEYNVKIAIGSDTHLSEGFSYIGHGVGIARRGWCRREDLLNTLHLRDLLEVGA